MLSKTMQEALNKQINEELYSSYLYKSMACHFEAESMKGFAHWMKLQAEEEQMHAQKFIDYVLQRGARVELAAIAAPKTTWKSPLAAFEDAYKHECHISKCINALSTQAVKENDHATHALLEWFVSEQVEEEANAADAVAQLRMAGDAPGALFLLDREMAGRRAEAGGAAE
jgi:ferritin